MLKNSTSGPDAGLRDFTWTKKIYGSKFLMISTFAVIEVVNFEPISDETGLNSWEKNSISCRDAIDNPNWDNWWTTSETLHFLK
jgi:hypothetical protein